MSHLKPGDKAPDFHGVDQDGAELSLRDLAGRKFILYFYPKDDTPGCTAEACSLRDKYQDLTRVGYAVVGVSPDAPSKHRKFKDKYDLPFSLIADQDHSIAEAYGAWGRKKFMGREYDGILRTTFLIDENGIILRVIDKVRTKDHGAQVLEH